VTGRQGADKDRQKNGVSKQLYLKKICPGAVFALAKTAPGNCGEIA
jgi:hypothetical protein